MDDTPPRSPWQRLRRVLTGPGDAVGSTLLVRWLLLRGLALVYLIAFLDLWSQIAGLIGSRGILPARLFLEDNDTGAIERFFRVPTIFWLDVSDSALQAGCAAGVFLALLVLLRIVPTLALMGLWLLYLSFVTVGQVFYEFQWDFLLLEAGFLAIFLPPWLGQPDLRDEPPGSPWVIWGLRLLCVRVIVSSGLLKLIGGNAPWHDLTALRFHFWTQPLPTWTAWLADKLPDVVLSLGVVFTLFVQAPLALAGLGPRRFRLAAFVGIVAHQLMILGTGNYTFFNLLTIVLCTSLLDDETLRRVLPAVLTRPASVVRPPPQRSQRRLLAAIAAFVISLQCIQMSFTLGVGSVVPEFVRKPFSRAVALGLVNSYGLFVQMTTTRPEIVLEGSEDGTTWLPYELPVKPGSLDRRPTFIAPFQARLDWQLWFAALGDVEWEPWVPTLMEHLTRGTPDVLALFARNPFAAAPPRFVRAAYYEYRFTSYDQWRATGEYWQRTRAPRLYAEAVERPAD